jgi:iron(III) transport system ATP-binding protein
MPPGPPELVSRPASPRLARFVGEAVLLPATFDGATAHTALGVVPIRPTASVTGTVMLRPEQISIVAGGTATVTAVNYFGADTRYEIVVPGVTVPVAVRASGSPQHRTGDAVTVTPADVTAHAWPSAVGEPLPDQATTNVATIPCA